MATVDTGNLLQGLSAASTTLTFPKPAGMSATALWFIITTTEANPTWLTLSDSFVELGSGWSGFDAQQFTVFVKQIDGTEGASVTFTKSDASTVYYASFAVNDGVGNTITSVLYGANSNPIPLEPPTLVGGLDGDLLLWLAAPDTSSANSGTFTAPTGYTGLFSVPAGTSPADHLKRMALAYKTKTGTADENATGGSYNVSETGRGLSMLVAITPSSAPAAALAGNAVDVSTAAGAITAQIKVQAASIDNVAATGDLSGQIKFNAAAADVVSSTANLTAKTQLNAVAIDVVSASGAPTTQINLGGSATDIASASAAPTTQIKLGGSAADVATVTASLTASPNGSISSNATDVAGASGALSAQINLNAQALNNALSSAGLTTGINMNASAQDIASAAAALLAQIKLNGVAVDTAGASASLTAQGTGLSANATDTVLATAAITTQIKFTGNAASIAAAACGSTRAACAKCGAAFEGKFCRQCRQFCG